MSVLPYQFEPRHNSVGEVDEGELSSVSGDDDGDSDNSSEFEEELAMGLNKLNRIDADVTSCCYCGHCKKMPVNRECLCCREIDQIKLQLSEGIKHFLLK